MGSVGPRTELCEQGRDTLAVQCTMRAVIKVLAILVPWLALTSSRPSVVDLSTLSLDAREDLNGVWRKHFDAAEETNSIGDAPSLSFYRNPSKDNNKNYIFGHKTTDSSAESFLNHAEASNGFGTKLGRFSYIDANGKKVETHYKATPGKGIQMMTNNLPQETEAVREAKDKFFSEFNARRKLHAQQKQDKSIVLKSTAVESGKTRKPSTAIVPQVPEDTPEVRRAKDQFFKEFNARKALHAKQRQGKEEDASMATHDEEEMDESEASLKENDEEEEEGDDEEDDEEEEDSEEEDEEEDSDEEDEDSSSSSSSSSEEDEEEDDDVNGSSGLTVSGEGEEDDSSSSSSSSSSEEDDEEESDEEEDSEEEDEEDEDEEDSEEEDSEEDDEEEDSSSSSSSSSSSEEGSEEESGEEDDDDDEDEKEDEDEEEDEGEEDESVLLMRYEKDFGKRNNVIQSNDAESDGTEEKMTKSSAVSSQTESPTPQSTVSTTTPAPTTTAAPKRSGIRSQYRLSVNHNPGNSIKLRATDVKPFTTNSGTLPSRVVVVSRKMLENRI